MRIILPLWLTGLICRTVETSAYTVVGIYDFTAGHTDMGFRLGADELFVSMNSIREHSGKNLTACGPMENATTSFGS